MAICDDETENPTGYMYLKRFQFNQMLFVWLNTYCENTNKVLVIGPFQLRATAFVWLIEERENKKKKQNKKIGAK